MKGLEIKAIAEESNVKLWKVAEEYGVSPSYFSNLLRHSFDDEDTKKLLSIIEKLST